jgi:hypothetical protein
MFEMFYLPAIRIHQIYYGPNQSNDHFWKFQNLMYCMGFQLLYCNPCVQLQDVQKLIPSYTSNKLVHQIYYSLNEYDNHFCKFQILVHYLGFEIFFYCIQVLG